MQDSDAQTKDRIKAALGALLSVALIIGVCLLVGMTYQDPPPENYGVEVNLGDSDFGLGDNPQPEPTDNPAPQPTSPKHPTATADNISTQRTENTISTPPKKNENKKVEPKQETTNKQPEINKKALFTGNKNTDQKGGSEGVTSGTGNQGKAGGDPNSNRYDGIPGNGGPSASLNGRVAKALPKPSYESPQQGKVIVKIWVNRDGVVTRAEAQASSSITDATLKRQAEQAALKSKFSPDPNATELQTGTITYYFRKSS